MKFEQTYQGHRYEFSLDEVKSELAREVRNRFQTYSQFLDNARAAGGKRIGQKWHSVSEYQRILDKQQRCFLLLLGLYVGTLEKPTTVRHFKYEYAKGYFESFEYHDVIAEINREINLREAVWKLDQEPENVRIKKRKSIAILAWIRDRMRAKYEQELELLKSQQTKLNL